MVRYKTAEPSTLEAHIMEGSVSGGEPSTPKTKIVDGSRAAGRTVHVNAPFHGRFNIQKQTFHAEDRYRGWFDIKQRNRPHWRPISWMVRYKTAEPSTLEAHIVNGSILGSEPSMSEPDIVEGSGAAGRTVHDNAPFHGRFTIQGQPSTVKVDIVDGSI